MAVIIDGKHQAKEITDSLRIVEGERPCLAILSIGNDPASELYIRNKMRACKEAGFICTTANFPEAGPHVLRQIDDWNNDPNVHGIIVQLPAPNSDVYTAFIAGHKDVDGLQKGSVFTPCTAKGVMHMLNTIYEDGAGKHAVVVGRSELVGRPLASLLLNKNYTITVCHSKTQDLASITRTADVLVSATGVPHLIKGDMIKPGSVVIDVGINKLGDKTVGDVCFEEAKDIAGCITPVPGGVGPMTVAMLLENTREAFEQRDVF